MTVRMAAFRLYKAGIIELHDLVAVRGPREGILHSDFVSRQLNEIAYDGVCE